MRLEALRIKEIRDEYVASGLLMAMETQSGYRLPLIRAIHHLTPYLDFATQAQHLNYHLRITAPIIEKAWHVCIPGDEDWNVQQMLSAAAKTYWAGRPDLVPSQPPEVVVLCSFDP